MPRSMRDAIRATLTHKTGAEPTAENRFHLTKARSGAVRGLP